MTGTILWLVAISFIVVGLIFYFYEMINEEKRKSTQRRLNESSLEDDAKELIVDNLTSSDSYQRQAMAKQLAEFDVVDEVIIQILQEMAESDEDRDVRTAAANTLEILSAVSS